MVTFRKAILIIFFCNLFIGLSIAQIDNRPLRIGVIADPQYANKEDSKTRFYRKSLQKIDDAVIDLNNKSLDMTIVLGDMVDDGPKDAKQIIERLNKLKMPFYPILGNHDFPIDFDTSIFKSYAMPSAYYAIEKENWKILFLNTNELSSYAVKEGSKFEKEYLDVKIRLERHERINVKPWNGGVGKAQLKWIKKEINNASKRGMKVLVITHHPLYPEIGYEVLNNHELLDLFVAHKSVKAVISGHNHAGNFGFYEDLPCITLEGMVETSNQNAYGHMELFIDRIIINGVGRLTSRVVELR